MLRLALPNKGRLSSSCLDLLQRAGLDLALTHERSLQAAISDELQALFVRAQDIPKLVADGAADLGITGRDLVLEAECDVDVAMDLGFAPCRLSLAVRDESSIGHLDDLPQHSRVATVFPRTTRRFFEDLGKEVTVVALSGAAEIAPHLGVADMIVDLVSSGSTLKINGLKEVHVLHHSTAVLITRTDVKDSAAFKTFGTAVESVLHAADKRYLMANVPRDRLEEVRRVLPGISGPTIVDVLDSDRVVAAHAVVDRTRVYQTIADLKALGAEGILVTRIERLMP